MRIFWKLFRLIQKYWWSTYQAHGNAQPQQQSEILYLNVGETRCCNCTPAKSTTSNDFFDISYLSGERMGVGLSTQEIVEFSKRFNPEVIYFRTFPDYRIASLVSELKRQTKTPLVMHFMDDWLSLLENNDAKSSSNCIQFLKNLPKGRSFYQSAMNYQMLCAIGLDWRQTLYQMA